MPREMREMSSVLMTSEKIRRFPQMGQFEQSSLLAITELCYVESDARVTMLASTGGSRALL